MDAGRIALMIPLAAVLCIFGIPIVAILTSHKQKVLEMKLRQKSSADESVMAEFRELKKQFNELRDNTSQYDMSFDTAMQRLDSRLTGLEGRMRKVEQENGATQVVSDRF